MVTELIGYTGSFLIVISMLMTSVIKLRLINSFGSIIFTGYAIAIGSYPTAAMNFCLTLINFYNLAKLLKGKKEYSVLKVSPQNEVIHYFFDINENDIKTYFPEALKNKNYDYAYIIFCDSTPAGILLGDSAENNSINIKIDYTSPAYRDCSLGKHLYKYLSENNFTSLIFENPSEKHEPYLLKVGFTNQNGKFIKIL